MSPHLITEKRAILRAVLPSVPFDGWSHKAMRRATAVAGYDTHVLVRAFPGGPAELVAFFSSDCDRQMLERLQAQDLAGMRIRERIATTVRVRLDLMAPHREAVRRALSLQLLPGHAWQALMGLYRTVDAMWWAAGDQATDFNHYTKRALLAGVYTATLMHWLNDDSDREADSWRFLDRRIEDVMRIQSMRGRLKRLTDFPVSPLAMLATLRHGRRRRAG